MLGNERAAVADSQQADYFRAFLSGLRADLESELAKQVRRLTVSQNAGDLGAVNVLRRAIRGAEADLRSVVGMVDALNGRFPQASDLRTG